MTIKLTLPDGSVAEGTLEELAQLLNTAIKDQTEGDETKKEFSVGDYVKVVGPTVCNDIKEGAVAKIIGPIDRDGDYEIELLDESDYDYAKPHNLKKLEITSRELSFFKAGRELNEFKIGDIVRVLHTPSAHPKYSIIEITGFLEDGNILAKGYDDDVDSVEEYIYKAENLELIAPAESRVDIRGDKENE